MACHAQDTVLGPMGGKIQVPQNSYMQQDKKQITMRLPRFLPFFFDIRRRNNLTSPWIEKLSRNGSVVLIPYFGNFGFGEVMWCKTWDPVVPHGESCSVMRKWSQQAEMTRDEGEGIWWCMLFLFSRNLGAIWSLPFNGFINSSLDSNSESFL